MLKVCPHCQARFYVSDSLRKFSGGQVRCGECGKTFDIQDPSSPSPLSWVEPSIPTLGEDTPKPSSHSPFEADSGTIENATQDEGEIVDFDPQAEPKSATTTPDLPLPVPIIPILPPPSVIPHGRSIQASPAPEIIAPQASVPIAKADTANPDHPAMIPAALLPDLTQPAPRSPPLGSTLIWALACLTLIALLAGQLAYNEREHLLKHPGAEPWVRQACNWLNCDLPPPADLNAIHLINRQVHTHPTYPGALMVTGRVENRANFPQHWPVMEMVFMDIMGRPIAARRLASDAYLLHPANGLMPPGTPADIRLDLKDPGAAAVSYEFRFLAP